MVDLNNDGSLGWFLLEFGAALVLIVGLIAIWREWLRRSGDGIAITPLLDTYERVWLQFGRAAAIERAVANLVRRGNLSLDRNESQRVHLQGFDGVSHPLEVGIMDTIARYGSLQIAEVTYAVVRPTMPYTLAQAGLIPQPGKRWLSVIPAVIVVPAILVVGGMEAVECGGIGATAVVLQTAAGALAVALLCLPAHRTRRGDRLVKHLQVETREKAPAPRSLRLRQAA